MSVVTLALAKEWLGIGHTRQDNVIQALLDGAEDFLEGHLHIKVASGARVEDLDGGADELLPSFMPVTAIASIVDRWNSDAAQTYLLVGDNRILWADSVGRPIGKWPVGVKRFRATYTGGFTALPKVLQSAVLMLVHRAYLARGGESSNSAAGAATSFGVLMDSDIAKIVAPYSRRRVARVG